MTGRMAYVHVCPLCSWSRAATSAVVLAPACGSCGSALEARAPEEWERERALSAAPVARQRPAWVALLGKAGRIAAAVGLIYAFTHAGWQAGGPPIGAAGFAVSLLFVLNVLFD
jgi:hypothetical protein